MDASNGITQLFDGCLAFFTVIYSGGVSLFNWFSTPIAPTGDELIDLVLESFYGYTPFELSFGFMLSSVLFMALVKFVRGFASLT